MITLIKKKWKIDIDDRLICLFGGDNAVPVAGALCGISPRDGGVDRSAQGGRQQGILRRNEAFLLWFTCSIQWMSAGYWRIWLLELIGLERRHARLSIGTPQLVRHVPRPPHLLQRLPRSTFRFIFSLPSLWPLWNDERRVNVVVRTGSHFAGAGGSAESIREKGWWMEAPTWWVNDELMHAPIE